MLVGAEAQHRQAAPQVMTGEHLSNYTSKWFSWAVIYLSGALSADYKAQQEHNETPLHKQWIPSKSRAGEGFFFFSSSLPNSPTVESLLGVSRWQLNTEQGGEASSISLQIVISAWSVPVSARGEPDWVEEGASRVWFRAPSRISSHVAAHSPLPPAFVFLLSVDNSQGETGKWPLVSPLCGRQDERDVIFISWQQTC